MSNEEKKRLEEYQQKRMRWIIIQSCVLVGLFFVFVLLFVTAQNRDNTYYVTYEESSNIDYKVILKDNNIYEEDFLGEEYSYVSTLVDTVLATFNYNLEFDRNDVNFDIAMKAEATIQIIDSATNNSIYKKCYTLQPEAKQNVTTNKLQLPLTLMMDYHKYNDEVTNVAKTLDLKSYKSMMIVNVTYNVESVCDDFDSYKNEYVLTLNIPLDVSVFKITESQSIPTSEEKTIACGNYAQNHIIKTASFVVLGLDVVGLIVLIVFIYLTRNTHINYSIKIKKIVNTYKSFIQKIDNVFDMTGYQVLFINSIREMLEIRDTLQSPILMSENDDKTMTQFIIPTNNKLLYVYEVKIDNYDEIYGVKETSEFMPNEEDEIIVDSEPIIVSDSELMMDDDDDNFSILNHSYSFEAKLTLSKEEIQNFYKEIIKYIKTYGVKVTRSFKRERIHQGRNLFATLIYRGKTLCVLFPIDHSNEEFVKYRLIDMSEYKKYSNTPSLIRVTSTRKVKYVIEILEKLFSSKNIKNINLPVEEEKIKSKTKETLISEGLIKKIKR